MILDITFSLPLLTWALVVNAVGYWAAKTKAKDWGIPLPVLLTVFALVLVSIWGLVTGSVHSFADFIQRELFYAVPNAAMILLCSVYGYDVIHAFGKKGDQWKAFFSKVLSVFKKKEAKA